MNDTVHDAVTQAEMVRRGECSPLELVDQAIARIERAPLAVERLRVSTSLVVRGSVTTIDR